MTAGVSTLGTSPLPLLVRAIGPGLAPFGVAATASSTQLSIYQGSALAAQTNIVTAPAVAVATYDWAFPAAAPRLSSGVSDAALTGAPTANSMTAICSTPLGTGNALVEFYDSDSGACATSNRMVNLSARLEVNASTGMVLGFVVSGEGEIRLLLRGVGPTLAQYGVSSPLADPTIDLYSGATRIASNDDWQSGSVSNTLELEDGARSAGAFALQSDKDAALIVTLKAGAYTLAVHGNVPTGTPAPANASVGTMLAEVYELSPAGTFDAARSTNAVGLDVYRHLAVGTSGNSIISPYSIESALALAYAGAAGDTRTEMASVLLLPGDNDLLRSGFSALGDALAAAATKSAKVAQARKLAGASSDPMEWSFANSLFGLIGYPFRASYLSLMQNGFNAPLQALDFKLQTEASRLVINDWVAEQTRQKILNLIPPGGVSEFTRLVLVNALYLKISWDSPFPPELTSPAPFWLDASTTKSVPTMHESEMLGYAKEDGLTVVTLNYLGGDLQFVVLLPDQGVTTDTIANRLTPDDLARWATLANPGSTMVSLYLPKFMVSGSTVPLSQALQALGMRQAFNIPVASANFDDIAPRKPDDYLYISEVFHQTYVALDEKGTEAAAATAVMMATTTAVTTPPPLVEVHVDRPFLFAIQHRGTGACLFFGRISNPGS